MFTGIIENFGEVIENIAYEHTNRLRISAPFQNLQPGESIAVDGVCLTVLPDNNPHISFDLSPETRALTTLCRLKPGDRVNLERAAMATTRLGGHYVSGHVDTVACVQTVEPIADHIELSIGDFAMPSELYLIKKGSIAVNGVSLTINQVDNGKSIRLMLVPHTLANTTLAQLHVGSYVNIEFDYIARIVAHQMQHLSKA